jgi:ADP-heptose:LPS heptosyltransferase
MTDKLLAINFGGIGDEILFLPVLATIKKAFPHWHITLLLEPRSRTILEITDLIDEIKLFDIKKQPLLPDDYLSLIEILRSGNYQTVISSGRSPLVACLLFASGISKRIGYDSGLFSRLLLARAVKLNKNQYAANMYHDLVQGLDLNTKEVVPQILVPESNLQTMQNFIGNFSGKKILIHPGTSRLAIKKGIIKTWPVENWASLIKKLLLKENLQVILAGGPDDQEIITGINRLLSQQLLDTPATNAFISAYGATKNLADLAALISLSDLFIGVDSAPMHIAVALSKPLLALFGPTDPAHLLPPMKICQVMIGKSATGEPGVDLSPDIVYQSAMDQLQQMKDQ